MSCCTFVFVHYCSINNKTFKVSAPIMKHNKSAALNILDLNINWTKLNQSVLYMLSFVVVSAYILFIRCPYVYAVYIVISSLSLIYSIIYSNVFALSTIAQLHTDMPHMLLFSVLCNLLNALRENDGDGGQISYLCLLFLRMSITTSASPSLMQCCSVSPAGVRCLCAVSREAVWTGGPTNRCWAKFSLCTHPTALCSASPSPLSRPRIHDQLGAALKKKKAVGFFLMLGCLRTGTLYSWWKINRLTKSDIFSCVRHNWD